MEMELNHNHQLERRRSDAVRPDSCLVPLVTVTLGTLGPYFCRRCSFRRRVQGSCGSRNTHTVHSVHTEEKAHVDTHK